MPASDPSQAPPFNLEDLVHRRVVESHRVELKASWNDEIKAATLRTVCAFANDLLNLNGGYIVLGVEERGGRAVSPPRGLGGPRRCPAATARIDEFLKELRLAEARSTGIRKIHTAMRGNGSPAARFDFDERRTYFRVVLPIHPRHLGASSR